MSTEREELPCPTSPIRNPLKVRSRRSRDIDAWVVQVVRNYENRVVETHDVSAEMVEELEKTLAKKHGGVIVCTCHCAHCKKKLSYYDGFLVWERVWKEAGLYHSDGQLHPACFEELLGRSMVSTDMSGTAGMNKLFWKGYNMAREELGLVPMELPKVTPAVKDLLVRAGVTSLDELQRLSANSLRHEMGRMEMDKPTRNEVRARLNELGLGRHEHG